uniref:CD96 molecule n=1 Tax=Terrapene triunguis TaxID=2587831 RepID=A0A674JZE9_9SAUR
GISSPGLCFTYHLKDLHLLSQLEGTMINTEAVHAFPGSDVTLECSILSTDGIHVTQTQWSKIDDTPPSRIAVYHPMYGIRYLPFSKTSYNYSVECQRWSLHLRNVSLSLSGQYECSFATYPYGTKAAEINLTIKAEDEKHYGVVEMLFNETLEIPCLENMTSVNLSKYPLKWEEFVTGRNICLCFKQGENGREETTLIIKEFYHRDVNKTDSLLYKERIQLGPDNALKISPIKIVDDGKVFSCRVMYHPERILTNITKVKVFGKRFITTLPLFLIHAMQTAILFLKAFPKPSLTWYVDGEILKDQFGGISIEAENLQDGEGFYELRSILKIQSTNQSGTNQTFWCTCSFPFRENKTWNISSGEIVISSGKSSLIMTHLKSKIFRTQNDVAFPCELEFELWLFSVSFSGMVGNAKNTRFSWPAVVAVLLLFCSFLIILGIRKWCQYQKEIMNRPPSFKPPPPPIKYTSMLESDGTTASCHELETL